MTKKYITGYYNIVLENDTVLKNVYITSKQARELYKTMMFGGLFVKKFEVIRNY